MIWESILFMLAFEASFSAVRGSEIGSDTAVVNCHALCVAHAVSVVATYIALQQLQRTG